MEKTQKKRYKLVIPWPQHAVGSVAYALKESMKESEPPHLICTKCYEDGRRLDSTHSNQLTVVWYILVQFVS